MEETFGRWLRHRRTALRLPRERLAEQVPCSIETIRKLESGERHASSQLATRLAELLAISPAERPAFVQAARTGVVPPEPSEHARPAWPTRPTSNLPASLTPLIGRDHDIAGLRDRLINKGVRLLTLVGPPGVGKTRLSLAAATTLESHFTDGVVLVLLGSLRDGSLVLPTIAGTLGLKQSGQPLLTIVHDYLRTQHLLLVLDNFEQVVEAASLLVELLKAAPNLTVLVTSRVVLRLSGEHVYPVQPLALPDLQRLPPLDMLAECAAVALFTTRARASKPDFTLTAENMVSVAQICARLDGLPLAIELAAARSQVLPPQLLLELLSSRMRLLTGGPRDLPARHQTLRSAIAWSYELLTANEQTLFTQLGVFVGGFTLTAARVICLTHTQPFDVLNELNALIAKSLVHPVEQPRASEEHELRFAMLETIREYANEQLLASGQVDELRRRHVAFFLDVAETAERSQDVIWLERLELEHDNLRACLTWAISRELDELAQRLTGALWWFWLGNGHTTEGRRWLDAALKLPNTAPPLVHANAIHGAGALALAHHEPEQARLLLETSLSIFEMAGRYEDVAWALLNLGIAAGEQGERQLARRWVDESLTWFRQLGNPRGVAWVLIERAQMAREEGDSEGALSMLDEAATGVRASNDEHVIAWLLHHRGKVELTRANYRAAQGNFFESLRWFRAHRMLRGTVANLEGIAQAWGANILTAHSHGEPNVRDDRGAADPARQDGARVALLLGKAEALHAVSGVPMGSATRVMLESMVAGLRDLLGEVAWTAAWTEGRNMELEQVIACAIIV